MNRDARQFCLAAAFAISAHAALFAYSSRVSDRIGLFATPNTPDRLPAIDVVPPLVIIKPPEPINPPPTPDSLGEAGGVGESLSTSESPLVPMSDVPRDFEQAWTRRTPLPLPSRSAPTPKSPESGEASAVEKHRDPRSLGPVSVIASIAPFAPSKLNPDAVSIDAAPPQLEPETNTNGDAEKSTSAVNPEVTQQANAAGTASSAEPDPAEKGESDLDPFAKEESIIFSPGGTIAQDGRDVKLARPHIDLSFGVDATRIAGNGFSVKLLIETDSEGHPRNVRVIESSKSKIIDDSIRLAAFDSWFGGKMPDRFSFRVVFLRR